MALLGPDGKPIKQRDLTTVQAEGGVTGVRQAFASSEASGLTPAKLSQILASLDEGDFEAYMTLAEEMEERDPHYASVLGQRKRAISGIEPIVEATSEDTRDVEIAAWVKENIVGHDGFSGLIEDLLDAVGKGFAVVETDWEYQPDGWYVSEFVSRTQRYFQVDRETGRELRLRDEADLENGIDLNPHRMIVHKAKLKSGHMFRGGIARVVAFGWMCKAYTLKDWVAFIETYGLPLRLGRYGPEANENDVNTLFRAVANIGTDAAAVLPKFMDIEFVDNKSGNGSQPIFENLARFVDEQVSKAVLGQTMTTDDGSSMAQAQVHNDVRLDVAQADAKSVASTLNRSVVQTAVALKFGVQVRYPKIRILVPEPEDTKMIIGCVVSLADAGVKFKATEARAKLGFSDPDDDDEVFGGTTAEPDQPPEANRIALNRSTDYGETGEDVLDEIGAEELAEWEEIMGEMLGPIEQLLDRADSYETFLQEVNKLGGLPKSRLVNSLVNATFKARSMGDVRDG